MTNTSPLRVAVVGSGPSGFYAAEHLRKQHPGVEIDLFDRLPTPYGLVRGGVAPDHPKIKAVTRVYDRIMAGPEVRFLGNVMIGQDLTREELRRFYHAVIYCVGAHADRSLGIPGEELPGSHAATDFVAWYNGHPDYTDLRFDLSAERVAVVGVGNVAIDVVRILACTPEELETTDIAPHALEALRSSRVREIWMLGRRGPVQAAFTNPELRELGELADADVIVRPDEIALDPASAAALAAADERTPERNMETLRAYAAKPPEGKRRTVHLRFLCSPVEISGAGRVERMIIARNRLVPEANGSLRAEPTGERETLDVGLVFRSVGYLGTGVPGLPLDARKGVIPNDHGRVLEDGAPVAGEYVAGWIKRGPSGVIGTNKPDAVETADLLLEDFGAGKLATPPEPGRDAVDGFLRERGVRVFSWADWQRLDGLERARGVTLGRPRVKFTRVADMLAAVES
jgi:ferredoxin--NADP+ reductase